MKCLSFPVLLVSACSPLNLDASANRTSQALVNGVPAPDDASVVFLSMTDSSGVQREICSGTLIAPAIVLTAAHCTASGLDANAVSAATVDSDSSFVRAIEIVAAPFDPLTLENDVALLRLESDVPTPRSRIRRAPLSVDDLGRVVRIVGFGSDENFLIDGIRESVVQRIGGVAQEVFSVDPVDGGSVCFGDSGGPAFLERDGVEEVAGVNAAALLSNCSGTSVETRVDFWLDFIDEFVTRTITETCAGGDWCDPTCELLDSDCADGTVCLANGVCALGCFDVDPDCALAEGDACTFGEECASRVCVASASGGVCARACAADGDCPQGNGCAIDDVGGACVADGCAATPAPLWLTVLALVLVRRRVHRPH